ncbi:MULTISPECIES: HvfB family MNIO-type RiPP peptide maturase [unclassified Luteimonas]
MIDIPLHARAVGLGLRRALLAELRAAPAGSFDFLEAAPENWIGVGGAPGEAFAELAARHPLACHGLSLSLGGPAPLDETFLHKLRRFLDAHRAPVYSEHLSACGDSLGHLYDLLPLPFSDEAVRHVSARIRRAQDILGRRIAVENISYYASFPPAAGARPLSELEFVNAVLDEADCDLLLDVNNIVVNATNHGYDTGDFLRGLPGARIAYIHVAGHRDEAPGLKIDTHGAAVADPVWALLAEAYALFGPRPTLLERDFDFPPFEELLGELGVVRGHLADAPARSRAA